MNRRKFCLSSFATAISGAVVGAGCLRAGEPDALPAASASLQLYKFVYDRLAGADWAAQLPAALATCQDLSGACLTSVIAARGGIA